MPQFVITRSGKLYKEWGFPHADIMTIGRAHINTLVLPDRARAMHEGSARRKGPFVNVDLPNVPQTLAESELLGHKRGAFSDAKEDRTGHFERAHRGTIFLDEIGVLRPELREKLLKPWVIVGPT